MGLPRASYILSTALAMAIAVFAVMIGRVLLVRFQKWLQLQVQRIVGSRTLSGGSYDFIEYTLTPRAVLNQLQLNHPEV